MPELRLVVLALQDRLAYGPTFESAMAGLFGAAAPSMGSGTVSGVATQGKPAGTAAGLNPLIEQAARDLADYQRLTAQGKLGEAGQKLDDLKRALDQLNAHSK